MSKRFALSARGALLMWVASSDAALLGAPTREVLVVVESLSPETEPAALAGGIANVGAARRGDGPMTVGDVEFEVLDGARRELGWLAESSTGAVVASVVGRIACNRSDSGRGCEPVDSVTGELSLADAEAPLAVSLADACEVGGCLKVAG